MSQSVALTGNFIPTNGKVFIKIEVNTEMNISAFVARQKANRFLILNAGDQLGAGKPTLMMGERLQWQIPVQYAPSQIGLLGIVGHLLINAATGELLIADGQSTGDLLDKADFLYERATS